MKPTKKYFLLHDKVSIVMDLTENREGTELYPAKDVTVAEFDTKEDSEQYIKEKALKDESIATDNY